MTLQHQTTVKSWFETGDRPTQAQFVDFIESSMPEWQVDLAIQAGGGSVGIIDILSSVSATVHVPGAVGLAILQANTTASAAGVIGEALPGWLNDANDQSSIVSPGSETFLVVNSSASATLVSARRALQGGTWWATLTSANSGAQNAAAINSVVSAAAALGGGIINLPRGSYNCDNLGTVASDNTILLGQGAHPGGTVLKATTTAGNFVHFVSAQFMGIRDIFLQSPVTKKTDGFAVVVGGSAANFSLENVHIQYFPNGVDLNNSYFNTLRKLSLHSLFSTSGIRIFDPAAAVRIISVTELDARNEFPRTAPDATQFVAYPTSVATSIAQNKITSVNSIVWQAVSGGTTDGGNGPTGIPGTTGAGIFTTDVADGTVTWRFVHDASGQWLNVNSRADSVMLSHSRLLGQQRAVMLDDLSNSGSSLPVRVWVTDSLISRTMGSVITCSAGRYITIRNNSLVSSITGRGVFLAGAFGGGTVIDGNAVHDNALNGIELNAGTLNVNTRIINNNVYSNSAVSASQNDGIRIGGTTPQFFTVSNNNCAGFGGTATHRYDLSIDASANNYTVVGNIFNGFLIKSFANLSGTQGNLTAFVTAANTFSV